jgi:hypothetical protein
MIEDYDNLGKKAIDILIDAFKFFATTSGIAISFYSSQFLKDFKQLTLQPGQIPRLVVFLPIILWLFVILTSVIAIYPRYYNANTDLEKEQTVIKIYQSKKFWSIVAIYLFIFGFLTFAYILAAQLWGFYPFI